MGYPIILDLTDRAVLVVGAGAVATRRIERLLDENAKVCVVSPSATDTIAAWAAAGKLDWRRRPYQTGDCAGNVLVFAATDDSDLNEQICRDASERGALANSATDASAGFSVPSRIERGPIQLTIDTSGKAPAFSRKLRLALDAWLGEEWAQAARLLGELREATAALEDAASRRALQREAAEHILELLHQGGDLAAWLGELTDRYGVELSSAQIDALIARSRPS